MDADLRAQLQTLSISRGQRVGSQRRSRWLGRLAIIAVVTGSGAVAWIARDRLAGLLAQAAPAAAGVAGHTAPEVRLLTVVMRPPPGSEPVLTASGKVVSDHLVEVVTKVSGQIVSLHFEQGDTVEQGQVLARLEDVIYRARRDEARAELARARAALEYYEWNFARIEQMHARDDATDVELADARRWRDDGRAKVDADLAGLAFAEKLLTDTEVRAPIAGVILERNVEVGDFVAAEGGRGAIANAQFASIADMNRLRVEVDVSELDIARLKRGMKAVVAPDAYKDRRYDGHVMWIDPGANYAKATVQVKVRIDNPDAFLRVEGTAKVAFQTDDAPATSESAGLWIPIAACRVDENGPSAQVRGVRQARAQTVRVSIAEQRAGYARIASGLAAGDVVIAEWNDQIRDGQRVAQP